MSILRNTFLTSAIVFSLALTSVPLASAAEPIKEIKTQSQVFQEILTVLPAKNITASEDVKIAFPTPTITSKPVPVVEVIPEPVALVTEAAPIPEPAPVVSNSAPVAQPLTAAPAPIQAPAQAPVAAPASGVGGALVASAYSQLGVAQDCTRMVENALGSIGTITGDIAPEHFFRFGTVVGDPQPGDLMIQPGHVAIYVGNGMAISGGFDGQNTVLHPASYLGGSAFVRVG